MLEPVIPPKHLADDNPSNTLGARPGLMTLMLAALMLGILAGKGVPGVPWLWGWLVLGACFLSVTLWMLARRRDRAVRVWGTLCLIALGAAWLIVRTEHTDRYDLSAYIGRESQLAHVVGEVIEPAYTGGATRGAFARFNYEPPGTRFLLRVRLIEVQGRMTPAVGDLMVRIDQADHRAQTGQRIDATGWLGEIAGPSNAGEFDYRRYLARRGIVGRLTMRHRDNWRPIGNVGHSPIRLVQNWRRWCADRALQSLRLGMSNETHTLGLLETMLLGRKDRSSGEVRRAFRGVGLAHLLSISGAHLGILLGLVWMVARLLVPNPPRAAMIVLVVLTLYLMAVPWRVPIVRSGIMAGLFCAAYATGRRVRPAQVLAFAAFVVLLWRPGDLFEPGFQLSFTAVAGLVLFVRPVSDWLWPRPDVLPGHLSVGWVVGRGCIDYLAVSLVAFSVVFPLVAYHFQMVNPLSILLSIMALPVLTALLGLGYFKILIGLFLPSAGLVLSGPLAWVADSMLALVQRAGDWPGAAIELTRQPSVAWAVAAVSVVIAVLSGIFAERRRALVAAVCVMAVWTFIAQTRPTDGWLGAKHDDESATVLTMFSVGDGSCYLLELSGHTLMFDCGSQQYFDVAQTSIVPALKAMGVNRIDTLILSHADMDHYGGSLGLADRIPVGRVLVPPQMLDEAAQHPTGPTAFLVDGFTQRGLPPAPITRGWTQMIGDAQLQALWPPAGFQPRHTNNTSIVLSVKVAERRILLNGDIQDEAIIRLMELENLTADITDLPHHGGVVESSQAWLKAVAPSIVLQSSGRARLYQDRWPTIMKGMDITRLMTARDGMSQVRISRDGHMDTWLLISWDNAPR